MTGSKLMRPRSHRRSPRRVVFRDSTSLVVAGVLTSVISCPLVVSAQCRTDDQSTPAAQPAPSRPKVLPNRRSEEDWSVLADPQVVREPLDGLKYMPLVAAHPKTYLSFGFNLRERFELDHARFFGISPGGSGEWLLSRLEWHADLRIGDHVQVFAQLQNALVPGKQVRAPVDQDRLDLEQAFVGLTKRIGGGILRLRLGRQLIPIDFQRFVSVREGPNLRQSYDAAYVDYQCGLWRVSGAYTRPVQTRDERLFDDYSSDHLTFSGIRIQRHLSASAQITGLYANYRGDGAVFTNAAGNDHRDVVDIRLNGAAKSFDWDIEGMYQRGRIGAQLIEAAAFGSSVGYTLTGAAYTPRLGLSFDVATGDRYPDDGRLETFNPLFPNGYYLANYTGFPNLIHVRPSVTVHPAASMNLTVAVAGQWRETTGDAVYVFPSFPLRGTAGVPGRYTGTYVETRGDWAITPHYSVLFDAVHYAIGSAIRQAGGNDANYVGLQISYGW